MCVYYHCIAHTFVTLSGFKLGSQKLNFITWGTLKLVYCESLQQVFEHTTFTNKGFVENMVVYGILR